MVSKKNMGMEIMKKNKGINVKINKLKKPKTHNIIDWIFETIIYLLIWLFRLGIILLILFPFIILGYIGFSMITGPIIEFFTNLINNIKR